MATIAVLAGRRRPLLNAIMLLCGSTALLLALGALVPVLLGGNPWQ
jgi:hypothetical protein